MSPLGLYAVETLLTLTSVIGLAFVVIYFARRTGIGGTSGPIELVGRLPLEGRRSVYLVKVGTRVLVLGSSEKGLQLLTRIAADELPAAPIPRRSFADILGRARATKESVASEDSIVS